MIAAAEVWGSAESVVGVRCVFVGPGIEAAELEEVGAHAGLERCEGPVLAAVRWPGVVLRDDEGEKDCHGGKDGGLWDKSERDCVPIVCMYYR